ncbi:probable E3 ubiquitin-protein ligase BAH1-like 1 [Alnus glutinosa]|uniref:probable E3 ubiquitin-protein ligase BAH1-like 1 n=1 Tax=Alnus glutinosa TaxID=3517 RepID=UPI002D7708E7|nr:probable E3 ubiquitin-protein ligase BAH1-like 1 [Alnus glutinosa]
MKFFTKHGEYMQGKSEELPGHGFRKLKKILKKCRADFSCVLGSQTSADHCPVCEETFFPSLLKEMSSVVGYFNERVQKLRELHLASSFLKYFLWFRLFRANLLSDHAALIEEGQDHVTYALINAAAIQKILKKYDKIHCCNKGQIFKTQTKSMQIEILQNPWLYELMALCINIRESKFKSDKAAASSSEGIDLIFSDGKPSLTCGIFDFAKLDIDLTCSICLETVFDPVSLSCGHMFCYMCGCSAASVTVVDGLKAAAPKKKCPLCRQKGVFASFVRLDELSTLLSKRCPDYWEQRRKRERTERIQQAKHHWENQSQAFLGI